jgi:hypothetical protein
MSRFAWIVTLTALQPRFRRHRPRFLMFATSGKARANRSSLAVDTRIVRPPSRTSRPRQLRSPLASTSRMAAGSLVLFLRRAADAHRPCAGYVVSTAVIE